ncbi:hypothetical protein AGRA3207_001817 [Actinomadura graeca]|uniref:Uncharacterized protein n=1 Tax=Actinomadura graeca TaxID=2750812 RepID=A0ABX8QRF6_9ACTN|nr:hypothetical protein [Actinomadura graeca]QXJ21011.1 hypothetical protein AGRA3207_001817 [Actinomadura graeca]
MADTFGRCRFFKIAAFVLGAILCGLGLAALAALAPRGGRHRRAPRREPRRVPHRDPRRQIDGHGHEVTAPQPDARPASQSQSQAQYG